VLKIWVDADALPGEIKEIILRAAQRLKLQTFLVANKPLRVRGPHVTSVVVRHGADVADSHIVASSSPGDFCITADIPLAALLVARGLTVIDPRGEQYSEANIGERLAVRDFMSGLREVGVQTGGPRPFNAQAKQRFASSFDALLTRALRERPPAGGQT
jgi:uncharacterized protein YaiI (UPF0178 family)